MSGSKLLKLCAFVSFVFFPALLALAAQEPYAALGWTGGSIAGWLTGRARGRAEHLRDEAEQEGLE